LISADTISLNKKLLDGSPSRSVMIPTRDDPVCSLDGAISEGLRFHKKAALVNTSLNARNENQSTACNECGRHSQDKASALTIVGIQKVKVYTAAAQAK
jgi:hypothetical protein